MYSYEYSFLTARETADFLRMNRSYVYRLLHQGILPGIKVGYFWRIPTPALNQFIVSQLQTPENQH